MKPIAPIFQNLEGGPSGSSPASSTVPAVGAPSAEPGTDAGDEPAVSLRPVAKKGPALPPVKAPPGRGKADPKPDAKATEAAAPAAEKPVEKEAEAKAETLDATEGAKRFAALNRKTAAFERQKAEHTAATTKREADLTARETALAEKSKGVQSVADLVKIGNENPVEFMAQLEMAGLVDHRKFLIALGSTPPKDNAVAKLQKQVDDEKKAREDSEKKAADERKKSDELAAEQRRLTNERGLAKLKSDAAAHIASKPEEYELLMLHEDVHSETGEKIGGADVVQALIQANWDQCQEEFDQAVAAKASQADLQKIRDRAILPIEEAAKAAEDYLLERAKAEQARLSRTKKLSAVAAAPAGAAPPAAAPARGSSSARGSARTPTLAGEPAAAASPQAPAEDPNRRWTKAEIKADVDRKREAMLKKWEDEQYEKRRNGG